VEGVASLVCVCVFVCGCECGLIYSSWNLACFFGVVFLRWMYGALSDIRRYTIIVSTLPSERLPIIYIATGIELTAELQL
jgi:hypothetical protein